MPCNTPPPSLDDMLVEEGNDPGGEGNDDAYDDDIIELDDMDEEEEDNSDITFSLHDDPVFCCSFSTSGNLAVSGGQDDKAIVWNTVTGENKFECTGHTDSVIAVQFNHDSSMVATAGMDGIVQAWDVDSGTNVWNFETTEITWMAWHPISNILFAGSLDGNCWKWSVPAGDISDLFPTNGSATGCGQLLANGNKCAVGYTDGSVKVWDTNSCSVIGSATGKEAHSGDVISIAASADGNLIATGSSDGTAKLLRASNCKVLHTWNCSTNDEEEKETVECIGFFNSHPLVATGTDIGCLRIFDISTYTQRAMVNVDAPIIKLICGMTSPLVYIATSVGVELYDGRTANLEKRWAGHRAQILDFAISTDQQKLLTASDDQTCKVFSINPSL